MFEQNLCWTLWLAMGMSGGIGGLIHYIKVESNGDPGRCYPYLVIGVSAALGVPLLLNAASSSLLRSTANDQTKTFVLMGLCLAASLLANSLAGRDQGS